MTDSQLRNFMEKSPAEGRRMLFDEYINYVYAIASNKLRSVASKEDIEECVSDIFADVYRKLDKSKRDEDIKAIVCTIAKCRSIDFYRRLSVRFGKTVSAEEEFVGQLGSGEDIEKNAEKAERDNVLLRKVNELGEPDSTIIIQQYFYGRTIKEIARFVEMTESAVQKRSSRAREKLRKSLTEAGFGEV